jgi:hypothetical protein
MSENLRKCLKDLKLAMKCKDKASRKAILKFLSNKKCIYNALREISMNIINKQIKLQRHHVRRLHPHVKTIKALGRGVQHRKRQQKLVIQSGGFLPWLLPLVASALPAVIDLFKK